MSRLNCRQACRRPEATPRCTQQEFIGEAYPNEAAVGISTVYIAGEFKNPEVQRNSFPLYNLVPPKGDAAEFAFFYAGLEPGSCPVSGSYRWGIMD